MRRAVWLAAMLVLLCSCVTGRESNGGVKLYYVSDGAGALLETVYSQKSFDSAKDIINELATEPKEARLRTVMQNAVCNSVEIANGSAYVDFSPEYGEISAADRTLCDACVVLTLVELEGVDSVRITVDGANGITLSAKDIMLTEEVGTPEVLTITAYQLDLSGRELLSDKRRVVLREGQTAQRCLFDELMKNGINADMLPVFPAKTSFLSGELKNGTLTLDLSEEFLTQPQTETPKLVIQAIARSFTELEGVDGVSLLVEGRVLREYFGLELPEVITKDY